MACDTCQLDALSAVMHASDIRGMAEMARKFREREARGDMQPVCAENALSLLTDQLISPSPSLLCLCQASG